MEELYLVRHAVPLNLENLGANFILPNYENFLTEKPEVFKLSGWLPHLEHSDVKELTKSGPEFSALADYVNMQTDKLNQITSFLLQTYDKKFDEYETFEFNGNEFSFINNIKHKEFKVGDILRTRVYFIEQSLAIYCYAKVTATSTIQVSLYDDSQVNFIVSKLTPNIDRIIYKDVVIDNDNLGNNNNSANVSSQDLPENLKTMELPFVKAQFVLITPTERERLVSASFAIQLKQLKNRAKKSTN